jgi:DNA mismatch repair protein MutH
MRAARAASEDGSADPRGSRITRAARVDAGLNERARGEALAYTCESQLLSAARRLAGVTLAELAQIARVSLPRDTSRDKGVVGRCVERALGRVDATSAVTDFGELGVELKTLPCGVDGSPRESTFVCYVRLASLAEVEWAQSRVALKLSRVLFVPIESEPGLELVRRRVGSAFLWSPSPEQATTLCEDYALIASRVADGHLEALNARLGRALQLRPKAANGDVHVRFSDGDGSPLLTRPRGFYLRSSFTAAIVRETMLGAAPQF